MSFNNGYIEKTGQQFLPNFLGCFPADVQPPTKKRNFSIIFNLSNHDEKGSHYVALSSNKENIIYFDSFGEPLKNAFLLNFVKKYKKNKKFSFNKNKLQDEQSSFCGIFCLSFLASQEKNVSLKNYVKLFSEKNLKENDATCLNILKLFITQ